MKSSFSVDRELKDQVKILVRKYSSLRHEQEPFNTSLTTQFVISGDVEDFNKFHKEVYDLIEKEKV